MEREHPAHMGKRRFVLRAPEQDPLVTYADLTVSYGAALTEKLAQQHIGLDPVLGRFRTKVLCDAPHGSGLHQRTGPSKQNSDFGITV